jgi:(3,5-dihydroxyphenyl)acetyl-CoA 1,2-dioxygenase
MEILALYDELTQGMRRFLRVDELCRLAAEARPGLLPSAAEMAAEAPRLQRDKQGLEKRHGEFLATVLADPVRGTHLCHAMLLPREDARAALERFRNAGELQLAGAHVKRHGKAAVVTMQNPRFLNAEDESTIAGLETAIDIATLDDATEVCVLRGGTVEHPKYAGRRLFGAGINLTHLYQGKIRFLWYMLRDLGLVNKIYRGTAFPDASPEAKSTEKPWIAALEGFAIGGHCQILLTIDYTNAARDAYMPRMAGDRVTRQAIMMERRIDCDSPEGRLMCDEIVAPSEMDAAIERTVSGLTSSGVVSAAGNRRAIRIAQEPLDTFRRYMSVYAREQSYCHFSPALIANLERNWDAANRRS